jgi:hypothetical protein
MLEQAPPSLQMTSADVAQAVLLTRGDVSHAGDGTRAAALTPPPPVHMLTYVPSVAATRTLALIANSEPRDGDRWVKQPCYIQDFVWADNEPTCVTLAMYTEFMAPLPAPPANKLENSVALRTI